MKKIATLLLLCMAIALFIPAVTYAEEDKNIPADTEIIFIYSEDLENYFDIIEVNEPRTITSERPQLGRGDTYIVYADELFGAYNIMQSGGTVGIGQDYMGYSCVFTSYGPDVGFYAGLYDEANKVFYYFPDHNFKIWGSEIYMVEYETIAGHANGTHEYSITPMLVRPKKFPHISVTYNDEFIYFDQPPVAENGRTLVPLRAIFEKLGAEIEWNGDTQTVTATKGDTVITLTLNDTTATKNGQPITLDVPAKAINGRTLVPVRFIADCFGVTTGWDGERQRVILTD